MDMAKEFIMHLVGPVLMGIIIVSGLNVKMDFVLEDIQDLKVDVRGIREKQTSGENEQALMRQALNDLAGQVQENKESIKDLITVFNEAQ